MQHKHVTLGAPGVRSVPLLQDHNCVSCVAVDSYEGRDVAIFNVIGSYLNANTHDEKYVRLNLEDKFMDIMCDVNPDHILNIRHKNGNTVIYLRILKAMYGCIESSLLWYELYENNLKELGFIINPYDQCFANKIIYGKECTICWYVDDNKVSHIDPKVNTMII